MARFDSSRERVERAILHLDAFAHQCRTLFDDNPPILGFDLKHDGATGGVGVARATFEKVFKQNLALELGEFFYQLRAALDNVYWEAAVIVCSPGTPPNPQRVEFPICSEAAFKKSSVHTLPLPKKLYSFIQSIQPYRIPDYIGKPEAGLLVTLEMIHDCARLDRHRQLHVVAALPTQAQGRFTCQPPFSITFTEGIAANFLENKGDFMRFGIEGWDGVSEPEIYLEGELDVDISVKDIPTLPNGNFGECLNMCRITTSIIIEKFAEFLP